MMVMMMTMIAAAFILDLTAPCCRKWAKKVEIGEQNKA